MSAGPSIEEGDAGALIIGLQPTDVSAADQDGTPRTRSDGFRAALECGVASRRGADLTGTGWDADWRLSTARSQKLTLITCWHTFIL
jgi:hypothetical protein